MSETCIWIRLKWEQKEPDEKKILEKKFYKESWMYF